MVKLPVPATRRGQVAAALVGIGVVMVAVVSLRSGEAGRFYPASGEYGKVTDTDALGVSDIEDFAIGSDDTLYLAVTGKDEDDTRAVISISPGGRRSTLMRAGEGEKLARPTGVVALGRDDRIYVVDHEQHRILTRSPDGKVEEIGSYRPEPDAADTDPGLRTVEWMTADEKTGDIYVAYEHKLDRLSPDGKLHTVAGARRATDPDAVGTPEVVLAPGTFSLDSGVTSGPAPMYRFQRLEGVAYDPSTGDLYAIDFGQLVRIDREGTLEVRPRQDLSLGALIFDAKRKNLYTTASRFGVSGTKNKGIARIDEKGGVLLLSGSSAMGSADAIDIDSRGNLYSLSYPGISASIDTAGDLLSGLRLDLKGRS